jgi:L-alanine-DL-glutamate epimerase-like enolase superfamily enzyme
MDGMLRGQAAAKSALDVACWDLAAQSAEVPVCGLLGGRRITEIPLYVAIPLGPPDAMASFAADRVAEGARALQLKLGSAPRMDADRVRAVRDASGADIRLVADANGAWQPREALEVADRLAGIADVILEQPCATLEQCLHVRRLTRLPMSLDESIVDVATLARAATMGAMEAINLKLGRVGGLSAARRIRDLAVALGIGLVIEDTWGGDLVTAAVSHLAASTAPQALLHASFMNDWVDEHVAGHRPRSSGGHGSAPSEAGLGVTVDRSRLGSPLTQVARP